MLLFSPPDKDGDVLLEVQFCEEAIYYHLEREEQKEIIKFLTL